MEEKKKRLSILGYSQKREKLFSPVVMGKRKVEGGEEERNGRKRTEKTSGLYLWFCGRKKGGGPIPPH